MSQTGQFTATEIKAGILVLVSAVVLIGFVSVMRGCGGGADKVNRFSADFTTIEGLNLGAEVRYGGVKAGKVVGIAPDPADYSRIRVEFDVDARVPVNTGSVASIEQISLTTAKHLEVTTGNSERPLHTSGDHIASVTGSGEMFGIPDLEGVVDRLEVVLDGISTMLGVERARAQAESTGDEMVDLAMMAASFDKVLRSGSSTVRRVDAAIADNSEGFGQVVDRLIELEREATTLVENLNAVVEDNRAPILATTTNLEKLSRDATRQVEDLTASLRVTLDSFESIGGNASDLVDRHRPALAQILANLEVTTRNLKQFSETLAEQPSALIRGARPEGRADGGS